MATPILRMDGQSPKFGLSSLVGAGAIVGVLQLQQTTGALMFTGLVVVGVIVQARRLQGPVAGR